MNKKNVLKNLRKFHVVVPIILVFVILMASFFLWREINYTYHPDNSGEKLAELTEKQETVQRKFSNRLLWLGLDTGSPLFHLDHVRTGENSQATILFTDTTVVRLYENSLILITKRENGAELELLQGNLEVQAASDQSKLKIKFKDDLITIVKTPLLATVSAVESLLHVITGSVKVEKANLDGSKDDVVIDNQTYKLSSIDNQFQETIIEVVSPAPNSRVDINQPKAEINFEWKNVEGIPSYDITISKNKDLSQAVRKEFEIVGNRFKETLPLGKYYWQVKGVNSERAMLGISPVSMFKVRSLDDPNPDNDEDELAAANEKNKNLQTSEQDGKSSSKSILTLSAPADGEIVGLAKTNKMVFKWLPVEGATSYVLEMKGVKAKRGTQKTVYEPTVSVPIAELNKFQWRVQAYGQKKKRLATSKYRNFSVVGKEPLPAPKLLKPEQKD